MKEEHWKTPDGKVIRIQAPTQREIALLETVGCTQPDFTFFEYDDTAHTKISRKLKADAVA